MDHPSGGGEGGGAAAANDAEEEEEMGLTHLHGQQVAQKNKEEAVVEGVEDQAERVAGGDLLSIGDDRNGNRPASMPCAQLTIFYAGSVCVYDTVTPEKAHAIMLIAAATRNDTNVKGPVRTAGGPTSASAAAAAAATATAAAAPTPVAVLTRSPSLQSTSVPQPEHLLSNPANSSLCKLQAELPIARRHSLQRFLEKRRDRLVSKNPYLSTKMDCSGGGLGSELSTPL